jgi:hypothetical protein
VEEGTAACMECAMDDPAHTRALEAANCSAWSR